VARQYAPTAEGVATIELPSGLIVRDVFVHASEALLRCRKGDVNRSGPWTDMADRAMSVARPNFRGPLPARFTHLGDLDALYKWLRPR
jgi:hypothetical protein